LWGDESALAVGVARAAGSDAVTRLRVDIYVETLIFENRKKFVNFFMQGEEYGKIGNTGIGVGEGVDNRIILRESESLGDVKELTAEAARDASRWW